MAGILRTFLRGPDFATRPLRIAVCGSNKGRARAGDKPASPYPIPNEIVSLVPRIGLKQFLSLTHTGSSCNLGGNQPSRRWLPT